MLKKEPYTTKVRFEFVKYQRMHLSLSRVDSPYPDVMHAGTLPNLRLWFLSICLPVTCLNILLNQIQMCLSLDVAFYKII